MRVVVFKFNHLGDNVVFVPVVQALRQRCPEWELTLLTTPNEAVLYRGPLGPQEVLVSPKRDFDKSYRRPWRLARWMWNVRRRRPDACLISFDQGTAAHLVAKLSGARVRIGGNLGNIRISGSLTCEVAEPAVSSPAAWHWKMARELVRSFGDDAGWPEEPPPPDLRHLLTPGARPRGNRKRVVIHAGASRTINQWSPSGFAAVARSLARDFEVIWIGHRGTTATTPAGTTLAPVDSIGAFADWLASADLFLGNNSGPMHLANALGCCGVAVTGPSAAGWDPYWHRDRWTVLRHPDLRCGPCEKLTEALEGCVNVAEPMVCLSYWTEDKVEAACRSRLERQGAPPS